MKDRTRLIRTPNSRIAPFCEVCGKVDGPLPFGRGEVRLHYHVGGARCEDHPLQQVGVRLEMDLDDMIEDILDALTSDDDMVSDILRQLEG